MRYYRKHSYWGWILLSLSIALLSFPLVQLWLHGFFGHTAFMEFALFLVLWALLFWIVFLRQRSIEWVELAPQKITICYFSNKKTGTKIIDTTSIECIEHYTLGRSERDIDYTIIFKDGNELSILPGVIPFYDFLKYCTQNSIVSRKKVLSDID